MYEVGSAETGTERYNDLAPFCCRPGRAAEGAVRSSKDRSSRRSSGFLFTIFFLAITALAACDSPTEPGAGRDDEQELVTLAYTMGLSSAALNTSYVLNVNGRLYDVGCPLQCWLPQGIVTLLEQMVASGTLSIQWTSPPSVYVPGTKTPILLQNGRSIPICSNGIDDDGDELADWPNDPGCDSPNDDSEFNVIDVVETSPPVLTAPTFIHGSIPFKGMKEWSLTCPLRGTLTSTDHRTFTALGIVLHVEYVKFVKGSGWVVTETETISLTNNATAGSSLLGGGWNHTLRLSNHEARFRISVLVEGNDGEQLLVDANNGAKIFCGL